ncbi:MAG: hypothetical protein FJ288_07050 [Planctomycetes bacterium]|nr:hypothetical protein [Planctomycetota bacterium]
MNNHQEKTMNSYPRACVVALALVLALCTGAAGGQKPQDPPWDPSAPTPGFQPGPVQNKVTPGRFFADLPTIHGLGFRWYIEGDSNRNAAVAVEYRRKGTAAWRQAQPMLRVQNEVVDQSYQSRAWRCGNLFAGSVLFLEPGTEYEVRLTMTDPDGGAPPPKVFTATTLVEPPRYEGERLIPVFAPDHKGPRPPGAATDLGEALKQARPGDVFLLHPGVHQGPVALERTGLPGRPIVLRGAGGGEAVIEGPERRVTLISLRRADHVHIKDLTLRRGGNAIHAGSKGEFGSSYLVVRRCQIEDVRAGIVSTWEGSENWFIADNVIVGMNPTWYPRPGNYMEPSSTGVNVYGRGHVVAYNRITRFSDAVSTAGVRPPSEDLQKHCVNIDIYNNDLSWAQDDIIETDYGCHNIRVWRNRCYNAHVGISVQPSYGGPVYLVRNEVYGVTYAAYKLHNNPAGIVAFHNTTCTPGTGFGGDDRWQNGVFRNNLFMGGSKRAISSGSITPYSTLDYNGYRRNNPDPAQFIRWFDGKTRNDFPSLEEFAKATGHERHGIELDYDAFVRAGPPQGGANAEPTQWDLRLKPGSRAVDAGVRLPNVNDDFAGKGPDLGAHEQGQPLPHYGPRDG